MRAAYTQTPHITPAIPSASGARTASTRLPGRSGRQTAPTRAACAQCAVPYARSRRACRRRRSSNSHSAFSATPCARSAPPASTLPTRTRLRAVPVRRARIVTPASVCLAACRVHRTRSQTPPAAQAARPVRSAHTRRHLAEAAARTALSSPVASKTPRTSRRARQYLRTCSPPTAPHSHTPRARKPRPTSAAWPCCSSMRKSRAGTRGRACSCSGRAAAREARCSRSRARALSSTLRSLTAQCTPCLPAPASRSQACCWTATAGPAQLSRRRTLTQVSVLRYRRASMSMLCAPYSTHMWDQAIVTIRKKRHGRSYFLQRTLTLCNVKARAT